MASDTKPQGRRNKFKMVMTDEEDWVMEEDFHSWIPIQIVRTDKRRVGSG